MGLLFNKTIQTTTVKPHMIINLVENKVTLLNGDQMTMTTTMDFDEGAQHRCYELLQFNKHDEVEIFYQDDVIYGIRAGPYMYGAKLLPGTFGYYLK